MDLAVAEMEADLQTKGVWVRTPFPTSLSYEDADLEYLEGGEALVSINI